MMDERIGAAFTIAMVIFVTVMAFVILLMDNRLNKYNDTIAEYVMCIRYNTDGDCSDIILSEYGEEDE